VSEKQLEKWWRGLSPQERAEALKSQEAGVLSEDLAKSLGRAGVEHGKPGSSLPGDVEIFLKARH
jgi:hypothetical protein